jgi:MFS family permease
MNSPVNSKDYLIPALVVAALILGIAMGTRNAYSGLWLQPMSQANSWGREVFSLTIAIQNLVWGISQPFIGYYADQKGTRQVLLLGAVLYIIGLTVPTFSNAPLVLHAFGGVIMGLAVSCCTYTVSYGLLGRMVSAERRSWAFGIAAAAGSFGQFAMIPFGSYFIAQIGWSQALWVVGGITLLIAPLGIAFSRYGQLHGVVYGATQTGLSAKEAIKEAFTDRTYCLLTAGYFVCGFQVVFIGAHLMPYLLDKAIPARVGVTALALIGLFNVLGTYTAGSLGQRFPKRYILSAIYLLRSVVISLFLLAPLTEWSVYLFAASIGVLWLSTVPPTNALVAQVYGLRYMGMLGGIIFFSHQMGSFMGVWLGGKLYDATGSYNVVWGICIALGVFAAVVHWPIDERALADRRAGLVAA